MVMEINELLLLGVGVAADADAELLIAALSLSLARERGRGREYGNLMTPMTCIMVMHGPHTMAHGMDGTAGTDRRDTKVKLFWRILLHPCSNYYRQYSSTLCFD